MAYITATDVQKAGISVFAIAFSASTQPTATRVGSLIDQAEDELNAYLRAAGYDTPLTNTDDISMVAGKLSRYCAYLAAIESPVAFREDGRLPDNIAFWKEDWQRFIGAIASSKIKLPSGASARRSTITILQSKRYGD